MSSIHQLATAASKEAEANQQQQLRGDWNRHSSSNSNNAMESFLMNGPSGSSAEPMTKKHKGHQASTTSQRNESGACNGPSSNGGFTGFSSYDMSREASLRAVQLIRMQNAQRDAMMGNSNHSHGNNNTAAASSMNGNNSNHSSSHSSINAFDNYQRNEQERKRIFSTLVAAAASVAPPIESWANDNNSNNNANGSGGNQARYPFNMPNGSSCMEQVPQFQNRSFAAAPSAASAVAASFQAQASSSSSLSSPSPQMVLYSKMQEFRRFQHQKRLQQQAFMSSYGGQGNMGPGSSHGSNGHGDFFNATSAPVAAPHAFTVSPSPSPPLAPPGSIPLCPPVLLARRGDALKVSSLQVLLRHQIEAFSATDDDVTTHTRGRNKAVKHGQVGIRCRHCAHLPVLRRQKGSTYFPATTMGLYQAAQNMNSTHMQNGLCSEMPLAIKAQFAQLVANKVSSAGAGRPYWASTAKELGLVDTEDGIYFVRELPPGAKLLTVTATSNTTPKALVKKEN